MPSSTPVPPFRSTWAARRFAGDAPAMGQYSMQKSFTLTLHLFAAGSILLGQTLAQQTPATPAPQSGSPAASQAAPTLKTRDVPELPTEKDKFSYALGMNLGNS